MKARSSKRRLIIVCVRKSINSACSGFGSAERLSTGSIKPTPITRFQSRFAMFFAKRGLRGEVSQSAKALRRFPSVITASSPKSVRGSTGFPRSAASYG